MNANGYRASCTENGVDCDSQKQGDRDLIQQAAPSADVSLIEQVAENMNGQGAMQKDQLNLKSRMIPDRYAKDGREDDRGMPEDHRNDKPNEETPRHPASNRVGGAQ